MSRLLNNHEYTPPPNFFPSQETVTPLLTNLTNDHQHDYLNSPNPKDDIYYIKNIKDVFPNYNKLSNTLCHNQSTLFLILNNWFKINIINNKLCKQLPDII